MNELLKQQLKQQADFVAKLHINPVRLERGYVQLEMPLVTNTNHIGTMHAGALFTLGELTGGALFLTSFDTHAYYPIVKDMQIRFRRPATTNIEVVASLAEEKIQAVSQQAELAGKADFTLSCQLQDYQQTVVAVTSAVYQIRRIDS